MMPKPSSAAKGSSLRVVIVTLDTHLSSAVERASARLSGELPGLHLGFHAAVSWNDPQALATCRKDIAEGDIIIVTMMFTQEHVDAVLPDLLARRDSCDAMIGCMSASQIVRLTRIGRFNMDGSKRGALDFLKRLRGRGEGSETGGRRQLDMVRRLPKLLRFIPGTAQDVRAYFLTLQYWLAGSDENVANMVRFLTGRYARAFSSAQRRDVVAQLPIEYPDVGVYHPRMKERVAETLDRLPKPQAQNRGTVGLLLMRSYILADNTAHYDAVIEGFEAAGFRVVPVFSSGLDARPAVEKFLMSQGASTIDAFVSLTGFSLIGGPAYNDSVGAADLLAQLDVPYLAGHALEFQSLEEWEESDRGLLPIEATMMIALPELDGAIAPTIFGGRSKHAPVGRRRDLSPHLERVQSLVGRVERLIELRNTSRADRRIAVVLFNFPPNAGATGTAAFLSVYQSLFNLLNRLRAEGYDVGSVESPESLRALLLGGNAERYGSDGNVFARIPVDDHLRRERHLSEIEAQWGPAPGRQQSDGSAIQVIGIRLGNVFVGVQPTFGYEGDPMRLLFERGFAPTHAFSAFYRFLREDFAAHAVLHFGTHGALEFMPGKQTGLSAECWPERMIGTLPNVYLYAANNPSEGTIAKRRSAATLVSYLTPSLTQAGLYRGLVDLKTSIERFRALDEDAAERSRLSELIQAQATALDLCEDAPPFGNDACRRINALQKAVLELEYTLIPHGLHVVGEPPSCQDRLDTLRALGQSTFGLADVEEGLDALSGGMSPEEALKVAGRPDDPETRSAFVALAEINRLLSEDHELTGILRALDGRFIRPVVGGDLLRSPNILPTGRNLHGFDPNRLPSAFAMREGRDQAERVLARHRADGHALPESVAMVLWGTDNIKTEGGPLAQALALMGAEPVFDGYGRLSGAQLVPLPQLGRPRIDVVVTLSGIFRDLLPLQTKLLAEAALKAASADEPGDCNFVRKHALAYQAASGCDLETAALRVFSNAEGAYGSNVNHLIDSGGWSDEDELCEVYARRKCFAYGRSGDAVAQPELLKAVMATVDLAYQNLDSVELGVTTIDHYYDSLGGLGRAIKRAKAGVAIPIYVSDQTRGEARVRALTEQVALETRTRMLNPKWYEGMLKHGYEGVRQIEAHLTNTVGWSATTGQVEPWVYEQITRTYVLDSEMRHRLTDLNPKASTRMAHRMIEAHQRGYWEPDAAILSALQDAADEAEDRLEGVTPEIAA